MHKDILQAIKNTLCQITVCGESNLTKLLGCIQTLNDLLEENNANDQAEE